ncbi:MAG: nucleoside 2-deoxyribosyltransferase [Acidobacteriota bacterium]
MRIYLACTVRGDRGAMAAARHMHARLVQLGHDVLTSHLLQDDVDQIESQVTAAHVYRRDVEWLEAADVLVAEASGSSFGVGFEVGYVLGRSAQSGQRAYVLHDASREAAISRMITGLAHPRATTLAYRTLADIDAFLDAHLARDGA